MVIDDIITPKWKSFEDALIDKNDSINEILKLYYLRGALTGEAFSVVESLETRASNGEMENCEPTLARIARSVLLSHMSKVLEKMVQKNFSTS